MIDTVTKTLSKKTSGKGCVVRKASVGGQSENPVWRGQLPCAWPERAKPLLQVFYTFQARRSTPGWPPVEELNDLQASLMCDGQARPMLGISKPRSIDAKLRPPGPG